MSGKQKKMLTRIILTAIIFVGLFVTEHIVGFDFLPYKWMEVVIFILPYLLIGYDIILKAGKNIFPKAFLLCFLRTFAILTERYL